MPSRARSELAIAAIVATAVACGDPGTNFVDSGHVHDVDGGDVDVDAMTAIDAGTDGGGDGGTPVDGATTPDASSPIDAPTQNAMWQGARLIDTQSGSARVPVAGMDAAGRGFVVWRHETRDSETGSFVNPELLAARFEPGTGWQDPMLISPRGAHGPDLSVSPTGDAMVVWDQYRSGDGDIDTLARRFTPATGWESAVTLYDGSPEAWGLGRSAAAIAGDGSAIALFSKRGVGGIDLYARHFTPSGGWAPAVPVQIASSGIAAKAEDVAMDASGRAVAVWRLGDAGVYELWSSRFSGGVWSTPVRIDAALDATSGRAGYAQIAVDPAGNAVIAFNAYEPERSSVWAAIGGADGAWQAATRLEEPTMNALDLDLASAATGAIIAVWESWPANDTDVPTVRARRFTYAGGWGAIESVGSSDSLGLFHFPTVAMSAMGVATVVWRGGGANAGIMANRSMPGAGWSTPVRISSTSTGEYDQAAVAAGGVDSAIATWPHTAMPDDDSDSEEPFDLWANLYR